MDRREAVNRLKCVKDSITHAKNVTNKLSNGKSDSLYGIMTNDIEQDEIAIDMAIKSLQDKKARYWKRRWLKQRKQLEDLAVMFESMGKDSNADMVRAILRGDTNGEQTIN